MAFAASFSMGRYTFSFGGVSTWHTHGHRLQHVNLFTVRDEGPNFVECRVW
jgi:hypothetical protein